MENKRNDIIELIQNSLVGKIDASVNFNPRFLAEAILEKLEFNKSLKDRSNEKIDNVITSFNDMINDIDNDMDTELGLLSESDTLLKNFIRGQKTACEKLKDKLKTL